MGNGLCCRRRTGEGTPLKSKPSSGGNTFGQGSSSAASSSSSGGKFWRSRRKRSKDDDHSSGDEDEKQRSGGQTATRDVGKVQTLVNEDGHKEVNEFVLIKTIGKGSYGKVKLVLNRNDGLFYAIKQMNKRVLQRKRTFGMNNKLQDVRREVEIMRRLQHKNIVRLYQVIDDPDHDLLYLVMELMEGGSIQGDVIDRPVGEQHAHSYFRDIVDGLDYLHQRRVVHRDIKPQNLLLTGDGVAKISDFGEAQEFDGDDDSLTRTAGSPSFYSPELCSAGSSVPRGRPSDVWALGVSLYCFVFGRVPFVGDNLMHLYETIKNEPLDIPAACNPPLADLLARLLDKNPAQRITVAQIKQHPWLLQPPPSPDDAAAPPQQAPEQQQPDDESLHFVSLSMGDTSQSASVHIDSTLNSQSQSRNRLPSTGALHSSASSSQSSSPRRDNSASSALSHHLNASQTSSSSDSTNEK